MMRSLYTAKSGMESSQFRLDVISNNLANVGTKGFKRSAAVFEDLMYQTLRTPGSRMQTGETLPTGLTVGLGAAPMATARIHTEGGLSTTGNVFDLAVNGRGFFQVLTPDGLTAYTRNGQFQRGSTGRLETAEGYPVQPEITVPDGTAYQVSEDGAVSYLAPGRNRSYPGRATGAGGLHQSGGPWMRWVATCTAKLPHGAPVVGTGGLLALARFAPVFWKNRT